MPMPREKDILLSPVSLLTTQIGDYLPMCWTASLFSLVLYMLAPSFPQQLPYFLRFHSCTCSRLKLASGSQALCVSLLAPCNEVFQQELINTRKCSCSIFTLAEIKFENSVGFFHSWKCIHPTRQWRITS